MNPNDAMLHPTVVMIIQGLDESVKKLREELASARADEREACAKLCERTKGLDRSGWPQHYEAHELAAAIRARGTT